MTFICFLKYSGSLKALPVSRSNGSAKTFRLWVSSHEKWKLPLTDMLCSF